MPALSDERLKEIAQSQWTATPEAFNKAWPSMLPKLSEAQKHSSDMNQRVFAANGSDFTNPNAGSTLDWWKGTANETLVQSHVQDVTQAARHLCNEFDPAMVKLRADRDAQQRAADTARAADELQRREKLKAAYKDRARERFVSAGGSDEEFERAFPEIWQRHLVEKSSVSSEAQAATDAAYRENF